MQRGFMLDFMHSGFAQARWVPGEPRKGFFGDAQRRQVKRGIKVVSFRCPQCGYLESYAPEPRD